MKKVLLIILLLLVVLGIAAGVGVWKVRHLADSKLLIKEETIFTLKPGTGRLALGEQLYADKHICQKQKQKVDTFGSLLPLHKLKERRRCRCRQDLPLYTADDRARDAEIVGKR